jgi:thiosulfate/3-mercaptopyruvate sulfurtransferase
VAFTTLVDAATLRAHLDDPAWLIVDCRHSLADFSLGRRLYDESHVPDAFFADMEHDLSGEKTGTNGRHPLPDPVAFASFLETRGARDATQIVAYDAGGDMFAARLWFLCRWIGHDAAAVLDGGFAAWQNAGYPTTAAPPRSRERGSVTLRLHPELIVDATFVQARLGDSLTCVVDARTADRFAGFNETIDPVAGHIPGARNRPFKENFEADLRWKTPAALREAFSGFGAPRQIVHQCGSGVSSAANMLAMELAGLNGSRIYAGSWSEWISDPSRPVERAADGSPSASAKQ